jgi:hypothetical protein
MATSQSSRVTTSAADWPHSRASLLSTLRWLLALWGCAGLALALWFAIPYVADPANPVRHELLIGVFIGVVVGLPAALAQPFLVAFSWRTLSWPVRALQLLPAVLLLVVTALLYAGGTI